MHACACACAHVCGICVPACIHAAFVHICCLHMCLHAHLMLACKLHAKMFNHTETYSLFYSSKTRPQKMLNLTTEQKDLKISKDIDHSFTFIVRSPDPIL